MNVEVRGHASAQRREDSGGFLDDRRTRVKSSRIDLHNNFYPRAHAHESHVTGSCERLRQRKFDTRASVHLMQHGEWGRVGPKEAIGVCVCVGWPSPSSRDVQREEAQGNRTERLREKRPVWLGPIRAPETEASVPLLGSPIRWQPQQLCESCSFEFPFASRRCRRQT